MIDANPLFSTRGTAAISEFACNTNYWPGPNFPYPNGYSLIPHCRQRSCAKSSVHALHYMWSPDKFLLQDVAIPNEIIGVVNILGPKWSEMVKTNLQPRLWLAIIVNYCSLSDIFNIGLILVSQAKHVPRGINWVNMTFECN